jgi:hypothetical protein
LVQLMELHSPELIGIGRGTLAQGVW